MTILKRVIFGALLCMLSLLCMLLLLIVLSQFVDPRSLVGM